jgi:hypothetical protein
MAGSMLWVLTPSIDAESFLFSKIGLDGSDYT